MKTGPPIDSTGGVAERVEDHVDVQTLSVDWWLCV